jgi:uncharacterized membrane protein
MAEQGQAKKRVGEENEKRLIRQVRFIAVIYRIVLMAGLLVLITAVVLLLVTDLFTAWILILPAALIALGIVLARMEYRLDMRLYHLHNQASTNGENLSE